MAKIKVTGAAAVVKSDVRLEDWEKVKKYRPGKLTIFDDNGEPQFEVSVGHGMGSIGKYGAVFGDVTDGNEKFATITLVSEAGYGDDVVKAITEKVGCAILNLNKVEETIPAVVREIDTELASIAASIEIG